MLTSADLVAERCLDERHQQALISRQNLPRRQCGPTTGSMLSTNI